MSIIHERYKDEAQRIRNEFIKSLEYLKTKEDKIEKYKNRISEVLNNIEDYIINSKDDLTEEEINVVLKDELNEIETNMILIQDDIKLLDTKIKKLKQESHNLYIQISEKYPTLTEEEIQKEILYSLKK